MIWYGDDNTMTGSIWGVMVSYHWYGDDNDRFGIPYTVNGDNANGRDGGDT